MKSARLVLAVILLFLVVVVDFTGLYCVNLNNITQKASADAFDGVFFTGRWWPFFIFRRKYV